MTHTHPKKQFATFFNGLSVALLVAISGCTLEPRYDRPTVPVPDAWPDGPAYITSASQSGSTPSQQSTAPVAAADLGWRDYFTDPLLQAFIEITLIHNPDARTAALNVAAARAQYRIQRADLFPEITATGVDQVEKYPAGVTTNSVGGGGTSVGGSGSSGSSGGTSAIPGITRFYDVGIGITSYEIDLFGRIRSLDHERLEQYFAYAETQRSTRISLIAEFGNLYLSYLAHQELKKITEETLKTQQASYDLAKLRFDGGVATELDLRQAEIALDTARANFEQYSRQLAQDFNAFVLVGAKIPANLPEGVPFDKTAFVADLAPGLPSEVLANRPDVLAAEHNLRAANADIGAARAAFFPSITLTGSYGTASRQLSGLFQGGSSSWTFSPKISVPIFNAGANLASLDLSKIEKDVNIANYEKVVETAFQEVANLLAARGTLDREVRADQALVDASTVAYKLADLRFRNGIDNYLAVLDSQRTLYSAQQTLINTKLAQLQNMVTLYKALGGGTREHSVQAQTTTSPPALSLDDSIHVESQSPPTPALPAPSSAIATGNPELSLSSKLVSN